MTPFIQLFRYTREKNGQLFEFTIKKKDFKEIVLYDVSFQDLFLFTITGEGEMVVVNWGGVDEKKKVVDEDSIQGIHAFIKKTV